VAGPGSRSAQGLDSELARTAAGGVP